jgi:hypothetical protein
VRIYIPSAGRAGRFGSVSTTLDLVDEAVLVVPGKEAERYRRVVENLMSQRPARKLSVLATSVSGIAETRRFIGQFARESGEKTFCMMDDDLTFSVRAGADSWQLRKATRDDVRRLVSWISEKLCDDVAHASVSVRQSNNAFPTGDVETLTKYNKRTLRVLAYQTEPFLRMEHGRVVVMEDFDVNLQLLRAGWRNVLTYWWAQDQRGTGTAGGCSTYRTREAHDASARKLAELHHEFVKLREKHAKSSSPEMRERLEVTIQWEKAYESSQKSLGKRHA